MEGNLSWRSALALLIALTSAWLIWHGTRLILTEPDRLGHAHLMHVSLASPPAPPAPPKVVPKPPKPVVQKKVASRTPVETSPHGMAPPPTNVPETSANTAPSPEPQSSPAPQENLSLENTYNSSCYAAIEEQKRYPQSKDARLQMPSGTVVVSFVLDRSGALQSAAVSQSAGSILDRAAIESLHRAQCPPFPGGVWPGQPQHSFTINLRFTPQ
jgi:periplasmic protein TonB